MENSSGILLSTAELADVFGMSERQVQRLVEYGVLEPLDNGERAYTFDLFSVVPQYCNFLASGVPISKWSPDV